LDTSNNVFHKALDFYTLQSLPNRDLNQRVIHVLSLLRFSTALRFREHYLVSSCPNCMDDLLPPFPALSFVLERAHWLQFASPSSLEVPNTPLAACTTPATTQSICFNPYPTPIATPIATPRSSPLVTYASLPGTPRSSPSFKLDLHALSQPNTRLPYACYNSSLHHCFTAFFHTPSARRFRSGGAKTSSTGSSQASHPRDLGLTVTTSLPPSELELENAVLGRMLAAEQDKSAMLETEFCKLLVAAQSTLPFTYASEALQSVRDNMNYSTKRRSLGSLRRGPRSQANPTWRLIIIADAPGVASGFADLIKWEMDRQVLADRLQAAWEKDYLARHPEAIHKGTGWVPPQVDRRVFTARDYPGYVDSIHSLNDANYSFINPAGRYSI
ncbi:hypothetical protein FRB90_004854, partial [Tulasnella sp. 427]